MHVCGFVDDWVSGIKVKPGNDLFGFWMWEPGVDFNAEDDNTRCARSVCG